MRISDWSSDVCSSDLVAYHDAQVARLGDLPKTTPPGVHAQQRDAHCLIAEAVEPGEAERLDRGPPVDLDVGEVVEEAGQRAGDPLAERVAQQQGLVAELAGGRVLAGPDAPLRRVARAGAQPRGGHRGPAGTTGTRRCRQE